MKELYGSEGRKGGSLHMGRGERRKWLRSPGKEESLGFGGLKNKVRRACVTSHFEARLESV